MPPAERVERPQADYHAMPDRFADGRDLRLPYPLEGTAQHLTHTPAF